MCNRYTPPRELDIEREWHVGNRNPLRWWDQVLYPRGNGVFIRRARDDAGYSRELVVGQWGLIPWFAKEPRLKYLTNNARSEELSAKASYKLPWARGQRCIIPAADFDEPNWESGKNVWWRFRRADGRPWGLAGLWNTWTDKADTPNGGNCYNCHQISPAEISYGTIGPSLLQYGALRGRDEETMKAAWAKIYNAKSANACSNMPRAGHMGILGETQIKHLMALLFDPNSPVNTKPGPAQ